MADTPHDTQGASQTTRALLSLRDLILDGALPAGERISELALVERLGVSRTPVRAALLRLQEEGLLDAIPSGGFAVRAFSEEEIHDAIEVRGTLEGLAARLAAERGVSATDLVQLKDCLVQIDAVLADSELSEANFSAYIELNARFHALLAELPRSQVVRRQLERAMSLPFASPNGFVEVQAAAPDARDVLLMSQTQHRLVVEAIEQRQGARAEALMQEHARTAHRNLQNAMRSQKVMKLLPGGSLIRQRGSKV